ncbi:MAG: PKD repeat protein [Sphingobacteriales bacterium]|jgi:PKD repeat protein
MIKYFTLLLVVIQTITMYGNDDLLRKLAANQASAFIENKGQLNHQHEDLENVYFYLNAMPFSMYVTNEGLSYYFQKIGTVNKIPLTADNSTIVKEKHVKFERIDMFLDGANIDPNNIFASHEKPYVNNYIIGREVETYMGVKLFQKIEVKSIYEGIDWIIYISEEDGKAIIKQDFVVHPFANPSDIKIVYKGAAKANLVDGSVSVTSRYGSFSEGSVYSYQGANEIESSYKKVNQTSDELHLGFDLGAYDASEKLVIDPPLTWCTYFGAGDLDGANAIEVDKQGNVFVSGYGNSPDLPTEQPNGAAFYVDTLGQGITMWSFLLKFNSKSELIWATYIGGNRYDYLRNCEVDAFDNIWLSGFTQGGGNFPLVNPGTGAYFRENGSGGEGIVMKFNPKSELEYSTLLGGNGGDDVRCMAGDEFGDIYLVTNGSSNDMPLQNPGNGCYFQPSAGGSNDIHLMRLNRRGILLYATYLGGSASDNALDIEIDKNHHVFVTGNTSSSDFPSVTGASGYTQPNAGGVGSGPLGLLGGDAFAVKFNHKDSMEWFSYVGGSRADEARGVDIDNEGNFYITGATSSLDFPTQEHIGDCGYFQVANGGGDDMFITKFNSKRELIWSTYLGADGNDRGWDVRLDKFDNLFMVGETASNAMPTEDPGDGSYYQGSYAEGFFIRPGGTVVPSNDIFIAQFNSSGIIRWATYYGTAGNDWPRSMIDDTSGRIYITGEFLGDGVETVDRGNGAYYQPNFTAGDDAFIMMFEVAAMENVFRVTTSEDAYICSGGNTTLSATGALTYEWSPATGLDKTDEAVVIASPTETTTYSVKATDANDCFIIKEITVFVVNVITPVVSDDQSVCEGESVQLSVTGGNTFTWEPPTGLDNNKSANPVATPSVTTTYVVYADAAGCIDVGKDSVTVAVTPIPTASFTFDRDSFNCNFNGPTGDGIFQWLWYFGDRSLLSDLKNPVHQYGQEGTFDVVLKVWNKCGTDSVVFPIVINSGSDSGQTSINYSSLSNLEIYPNPFNDYLTIELNSELNENVVIEIFDVLGVKQQAKISNDNENYQLNTSSLNSGIYFISVRNENTRVVRKVKKN